MIKLIVNSWLFGCLIVFVTSCEFTESQLVKEQAITFEQEIAYRQRKGLELEGKLKRANEMITKLERQLECKSSLEEKE